MMILPRNEKTRITCKETGKLIATVDQSGIAIWCLYEKKPELITWADIDEHRALLPKGESVQCQPEQDEHREAC